MSPPRPCRRGNPRGSSFRFELPARLGCFDLPLRGGAYWSQASTPTAFCVRHEDVRRAQRPWSQWVRSGFSPTTRYAETEDKAAHDRAALPPSRVARSERTRHLPPGVRRASNPNALETAVNVASHAEGDEQQRGEQRQRCVDVEPSRRAMRRCSASDECSSRAMLCPSPCAYTCASQSTAELTATSAAIRPASSG